MMDALKIMEAKSVNKAKIDWNAVQQKTLSSVIESKTISAKTNLFDPFAPIR